MDLKITPSYIESIEDLADDLINQAMVIIGETCVLRGRLDEFNAQYHSYLYHLTPVFGKDFPENDIRQLAEGLDKIQESFSKALPVLTEQKEELERLTTRFVYASPEMFEKGMFG